MPRVLRWLSTKLNCSSQTASLLAATAGGDVEVVRGVRQTSTAQSFVNFSPHSRSASESLPGCRLSEGLHSSAAVTSGTKNVDLLYFVSVRAKKNGCRPYKRRNVRDPYSMHSSRDGLFKISFFGQRMFPLITSHAVPMI